MNSTAPFIPPRTRKELASPAPPGHRHEQIKNVVLPLLGSGLSVEAIFVQLRGMYAPDVPDREIHNLIEWAASKNPVPCGHRWNAGNCGIQSLSREIRPERVTTDQAIANAEKWLGYFRCDEDDLWHIS